MERDGFIENTLAESKSYIQKSRLQAAGCSFLVEVLLKDRKLCFRIQLDRYFYGLNYEPSLASVSMKRLQTSSSW